MLFGAHSLNSGGEIFAPQIRGVWVFREKRVTFLVTSESLYRKRKESLFLVSFVRGLQLGDGMGGGRNGCFWGAPILHILWKNAVFFRVLAKNRGALKMAVPTTTHPIPQLTPSDFESDKQGGSGTEPESKTGTVGTVFPRNRKRNWNRRNRFPETATRTGTDLSY